MEEETEGNIGFTTRSELDSGYKPFGLGVIRSRRYAILVEDEVVKLLN